MIKPLLTKSTNIRSRITKKAIQCIQLTVLLTFFGSLCYSQDSDFKKFRFGLKGNVSANWFKTFHDHMERDGAGLGYGYGIMGDIHWTSNYAFSLGIDLMTFKGGIEYTRDTIVQITEDTAGNTLKNYFSATSKYDYAVSYVNLPIGLKMKTNEIGYLTYYGLAGLDIGVKTKMLANADYTYLIEQSNIPPSFEKEDYSTEASLFRLGFFIGGGVEWNLTGNTNIMFGLKYGHGFSNHFDKNHKTLGDKQENKTVTFDKDGDVNFDNAGNLIFGDFKNAQTRYVELSVGVFF
jgi:opacity protein-like surface antigen